MYFVFFFKQKTAYEMRISDWSSDVCSSDLMKKAKLDDGVVKRQLAMLSSMTSDERKKPDLIKASRKQRIAVGSGTSAQAVNKLLKQHKDATRIMKRVQKMGKKGMLRGGLGGLMGEIGRGEGRERVGQDG